LPKSPIKKGDAATRRYHGRGDLENADLTIGAGDTVSAALELYIDFAIELSGCPKLCRGQ
jgi:hypothetical protein